MKKQLLLLSLSLALSACSVTTSQKIAPELQQNYWQDHLQQIGKIEHYQVRGTFAYLSNKQKSFAHFFWQQYSAQDYTLRLNSTFGSTLLEIESHNHYVKLTDQQGKIYVGSNTQELIHKLTDMDIPLSLLQSWMLGMPGDSQQITLNDAALLKTASQTVGTSHWSLLITEYATDVSPALPKKLELDHDEEKIKLKIDKWSL